MKDILITNNEVVKQAFEDSCDVVFLDVDFMGILTAARDYVHKGHALRSHPLSGSVKPNENPYKSILISYKVNEVDLDSLRIIENAVAATEKFPVCYESMTDEVREDFKRVDYSLIKSAFCNINGFDA